MKNNIKKSADGPVTQSAAMIILVSVVVGGLISRMVLTALDASGVTRIVFFVIWTLLTAIYLNQTGNKRTSRIYLLVVLGIALFTGLAVAYFNR
jgi:uncharacterized membrane protein YwzB